MPRNIKLTSKPSAKPISGKPTSPKAKPSGKQAKAGKPATPAPEAKAKRERPAPTKLSGHRSEILAGNRYPFGKINGNDEAYLAFYASVGCTAKQTVNLATVQRATPTNPFYTGSASNASSNLGYVNRLRKAGYLDADTDAHTIRFANADAEAYAKARLAKLRKPTGKQA